METVTLRAGETEVDVVPERGAIVTRVAVAGRELLYLDGATLADPSKNVRGGIPLLFPFAGRLVDDRLTVPTVATTMKQHGFGRQMPWHPRHGPRAADHLDLGLGADDATRAVYPYEFACHYRVQALARGVSLDLIVKNRGSAGMPIAPGWHPYFVCTDKRGVGADVAGWDPARLGDDVEFDFGLPLPRESRFDVPGVGGVRMTVSEGLRHLQVWSLPGKPFVCLEPFAGPANWINTPGRDEVPGGGERRLAVTIELAPD